MSVLKPCPVCGTKQKPQLIKAEMLGVTLSARFWCNNCGFHSSRKKSLEEAIEAWNRGDD